MTQDQDQIVENLKEDAMQLERCYNRTFKSDDGKVVFNDLIEHCFANESTYVPGAPEAMAVNEGCRRVFLRIAQKTRMDMSVYYLEQKVKFKKKKG